MTDDLDKLRAALRAAPDPDPNRKAAILAAATENFAATQGMAGEPRPISDRPQGAARIWIRISDMIATVNTRAALLAGSSVAVLALAVVVTGQWNAIGTGGVTDGAPLASDEERQRLELRLQMPGELVQEQIAQTEADDGFADLAAAPKRADVAPMAEKPLPMMLEDSAVSRFSAGSPQPAAIGDGRAVGGVVAMEAPAELVTPDDRFPEAEPNGLKITAEEPVSTFSIDVDTTSYALWRMSVMDGYPLPTDALRIEEMVNYFDYGYAAPDTAEVPFSTSVSVTQTPWNPGTKLMQVGIQGYDVAMADRPPMGLVFLIDTSGSMEDPMKLPLLIKSFSLLLNTLSDDDTVAIVTYAGSAGTALEPTPASERDTILASLQRLAAGGSTAGQAGLQQAYGIAEGMVADGQSARVILATDGDFNVGISDPEALKDYVAQKRESGVALSVLGFGRGNYTDTIMQALAQNGNGVAAYIDSLAEAQKVLVEDVTGALMTIASDVKIQVEFNPARISEYRLIGYETRALNREDFNDDTVDAGDIGAGHSVTAIYEITPKGSDAELADPLRYQAADTVASVSDEYAFLKLRYKRPGERESRLITTPVTADTAMIAADDVNFATAVAGAGRLLRGEALGDWSLSDAAALASGALGEDPFGYRAEFLRLVRLAAQQR